MFNPTNQQFGNNFQVTGTAFWLSEYRVLITCAHVVQGLLLGDAVQTGLLMIGNMGDYSRAAIASLDLAHDLAVLKIIDKPDSFIDSEAKTGVSILERYPQVGEAVAYAGFPLGSQLLNSAHAPTFSDGVVAVQLRESPLRKEIQVTGAVVGGYSGAPVVLREPDSSRLIGVLARGPSSSETQGNIFMAISWEHVKAIAELATS
ncbi:MAG: trypsin-like peptidase domain-containing protein [Patescibacteria group bacterium]|nr:trypsin-like peptidase domain-containing protein [Patescibacteria group bacterium]